MKNEKVRRIWIFVSAYGVVFAFLSWFHEAVMSGEAILWKGPLALLLGFIVFRIFVDKI